MGAVFLAEHMGLGRKFAIKVLNQELSGRREFIERFVREARAATAIDHPHVIEVVDTGYFPDGTAYYVMEHLQGEDLARTVREASRLPWQRVHHIALQICDALASAHAKGIIHRDLKPENCFRITRDADTDFIKLLDFGIAKLLGPPGTSLTNTGELLGTPYYMAPEQAMGQDIDHRVDVYALGAMLYQLLTGRVPHDGRNNIEVLAAVLTRAPEAIHVVAPDAEVPPQLEDIVERAMQKEPGWRFQSMTAFAEALRRIPNAQTAIAAPAPTPAPAVPKQTPSREELPYVLTEAAPEPAIAPAPEDSAGSSAAGSTFVVAQTPVALSIHASPQTPPPTTARPRLLFGLGLVLAVAAGSSLFLRIPPSTTTTPIVDSDRSTPLTVIHDQPAKLVIPSEPSPPPTAPETPLETSPGPSGPPAVLVTPIATQPPAPKQPKTPTTQLRSKPDASKTHANIAKLLAEIDRKIQTNCHSRFGDSIVVTVTLEAATGKLKSRALLPPHEESIQVWPCIRGFFDRAKFPPFTGGDYTQKVELEISPQN